MDKDKLLRQLMPMFLGELDEHLRSLNADLLAWEKEPTAPRRAELLQTMFRAVHSLKGAARSVGIGPVAKTCHEFEDLLSAARDNARPLAPEAVSLLFEALDAWAGAGQSLRKGEPLQEYVFATLSQRLAQTTSAEVPAPCVLAAGSPAVGEPPERPSPIENAPAATAPPQPLPTPPPAAPPVRSGATRKKGPGEIGGTVRVGEDKLDLLLSQTGELLVARQRIATRSERLEELCEHVAAWRGKWNSSGEPGHSPDRLHELDRDLEQLARELVADSRQLGQACAAVEDEVHRIRMLPFSDGIIGLERAVRDLARGGGKQVELAVAGGDIEVDRAVLEGLADPLLHLVRNSVDHGLETPADRRQAGKPEMGRITVTAAVRGSVVEVVVADDGRGLNLDKIRERSRASGLAEAADERELVRRIFLPGFSTAAVITDVSGRGVGLDVVRERVESLRGTIEVGTTLGQGTRFTLTLPLTLTTIAALLFEAGGRAFAVASTNVLRLVRFGRAEVSSLEGQEVLRLGGAPLALAPAATVLGLPGSESCRDDELAVGIVLSTGDQQLVLVVDEVLAAQELVVKSLGSRIRRTRHVSGAALLPSGRIALVLNAGNLIRDALDRGRRPAGRTFSAAEPAGRKRLLVADDSVTTRNLLKIILEAAGYDVTAAVDGRDAWQRLQEREFDLVVSDVEMPHLDGFELVRAMRGSRRQAALPVILVTGRECDEDKIRGAECGANAYLVKSAFDQRNLLETIAQLI